MSKEKSPAFQFYASDFLSDFNVQQMSMEEEGCYVHLLALCWREGSLPANINSLAAVCKGIAPSRLVIDCFTEKNGRLYHGKLEHEREKQKIWRKLKSESGKRGASARWNKRNDINGSAMPVPLEDHSTTIGQPLANDSFSVFSLQSSVSKTNTKEKLLCSSNTSESTAVKSVKIKCETGAYCSGNFRQCHDDFERLWKEYPRRKPGKKDCLKAWCKVYKAGTDIDAVISFVIESCKNWTDPKYIPHLTTFLNRQDWECGEDTPLSQGQQYEAYHWHPEDDDR